MLNQIPLLNIHRSRFLIVSVAAILGLTAAGFAWPPALWGFIVIGPLVVHGLLDMTLAENSILRNFPVLGHLRYLSRAIAPEIHQYFVEANTDGRPFDRNQRDLVDGRSERSLGTYPFGTERDLARVGSEWAPHSIYPRPVPLVPRHRRGWCPNVPLGVRRRPGLGDWLRLLR